MAPQMTERDATSTVVTDTVSSELWVSSAVADHDKIARLAYSYWEARGCPVGSPEEDWFRAEYDLQSSAAAATA